MNEEKETKESENAKDEKAHFDMYHFFSRKDVIFIGLMILLLLIYFMYLTLSGNTSA